MSNSLPPDLFFRDVVASYVTAPRFVRRNWIALDLGARIGNPEYRFVLITAEPGAGKSALVAQLAAEHTDWPVFFIRRDQRASLGEVGARSFLLRIGLQLAAIHPELFTLDQVRIDVEQRVGSSQGDVVGAEIERIRASPFHSTVIRIRQQIDNAGGSIEGVKIGEWITDPRLLAVEDLQQMALFDPARALQRLDPKQRIVILVDALDELRYHDEERNLLDWLSNCPPLPDNVCIVLTSRPTHGPLGLFIEKRGNSVSLLPIDAADPRVQGDLREYALELLAPTEISDALAKTGRDQDVFLKDLIEKADGNIGYLAALGRAFDQARAGAEQRSMLIELLSLKRLPDDIQGLYGFFLHLIQNGPGRKDIRVTDPATGKTRLMEAWPEVYQPILALLVVTFEPLTLDQIHALAGTLAGRPQVAQALDWLDQFLDHMGNARRLYHATVVEFLTSAATQQNDSTADLFVDVDQEHARLAGLVDGTTVWKEADNARESCRRNYFKRHYIEHLFAAKAWEQLYSTIDAGLFGREKLRFDPSTLQYSRDVDLAIRAVSRPEADEPARLQRVPRLWRYRLLRVALSNFADDLPASGYLAMVLMGRASEAADLAQLITEADRQSMVLVQLASKIALQPIPSDKAHRLLQGGFEIAERVDNDKDPAAHLSQLFQMSEGMLQAVPLARQAALRLARALPTAAARAQAISTLASYLPLDAERAALDKEFFQIVNSGAEGTENDALFFICATSCSKAHDLPTAHAAISHIGFAGLRIEALTHTASQELALGDATAAEASRNEAAELVDIFPQGAQRAHAGVQLARVDLAINRADRAALVLGSAFEQLELPGTPSPTDTKTLAEMAGALQRVGDGVRREATINRIYELAMADLKGRVITPGHGYSFSFVAIEAARALAGLDECDRALQVIEQMLDHERSSPLAAVAESFARQSLWDRALEAIQQIKTNQSGMHMRISVTLGDEVIGSSDYDAGDRALITIVDGLAKATQWERARQSAETIGSIEPRLDALSQIAARMHEAGQAEAAVALVKKVLLDARLSKFVDRRDQAGLDCVELLTHSRCWVEAEAAASAIADARVRAQGQYAIAHALIKEGDFARVQNLLSVTGDPAVCAKISLEVARQAAKGIGLGVNLGVTPHLLEARDYARRESDMEERAELLRSTAVAFGDLSTGAFQEAIATMNEVVITLSGAPPFRLLPSPWCATIAAFAKLGNWQRALEIADGLLAFHAFDGCSAFCELAIVSREMGDTARARTLIDKARDHVGEISFPPMQANMRATIAEEYAREGHMDEAQSGSLVTSAARSEALVRIASVLAGRGDWAAAQTMLLDLPEDANADSAKVFLVDSLLKAGQPQQARLSAGAIGDAGTRAEQILAVGTALLASGMREEGYAALEEAIDLSRSLFPDTAADIIRDITTRFVGAGDSARAISLVEERWLAATTHAELLPLIRIAEPLVAGQPDIANGIYKSFTWIDEVLEAF